MSKRKITILKSKLFNYNNIKSLRVKMMGDKYIYDNFIDAFWLVRIEERKAFNILSKKFFEFFNVEITDQDDYSSILAMIEEVEKKQELKEKLEKQLKEKGKTKINKI